MTDYSAAVERLRTSLDADTHAALKVIDRHSTRFIADCAEAELSPEDQRSNSPGIEGSSDRLTTQNQISTTSGGSAGCRSVRSNPGGNATWISASVSATSA